MLKRLEEWLRRQYLLLLRKRSRGLYYIHSGETLPPPFAAEEEQEWIKRLMTGEQEAKNALIEHNLRLVVYIARKFENTGVGIEDLISIGTIGLIKVVNTFDASKKIN